MVHFKKYNPIFLLLLSLLFLCTTCKKEKYDDVTYYNTIGIGYVYLYDAGNSYPVYGVEVTVSNCIERDGTFFGPAPPREIFTTDETGKYQVRFIKHTRFNDVWQYLIVIGFPQDHYIYCDNCYYSCEKNDFVLYPDAVLNAQNKTIVFDTVKLYKRYYNK